MIPHGAPSTHERLPRCHSDTKFNRRNDMEMIGLFALTMGVVWLWDKARQNSIEASRRSLSRKADELYEKQRAEEQESNHD